MPTWITQIVADGKMTSGKEFLLRCARQFGALIHMRDDDSDAVITLPQPNTAHYDSQIVRSLEKLHNLKNMTFAEAAVAIEQEYQKELQRYKETLDRKAEIKNHYIDMMDKIQEWEPPTSEHVNLKDFAMKQLNESVDWDCDTKYDYEPVRMDPEEWLKARIEAAEHDFEWNTQQRQDEIDRVTDRNKWLTALIDSLKELE